MQIPSRPFRINLSSWYREYLAPLRLGLVFLSVLLLSGIVWDVKQVWVLRAQARELEPALQRVREQDRNFLQAAAQEGVDLSDAALERLPRDIAFANRLIAQRTFSWTTLLSDLEQTVPQGLAIKGIQNDFKESITIRLSGSALSFDAVTAFTLALGEHPTFHDPRLAQHREREDGVVDFNLTVGYRGQQT